MHVIWSNCLEQERDRLIDTVRLVVLVGLTMIGYINYRWSKKEQRIISSHVTGMDFIIHILTPFALSSFEH